MNPSTLRLVVGLLFIGAVVYLLLPDSAPPKKSKKLRTSKVANAFAGNYNKADYESHFTDQAGSVRNAFNPLIKVVSNANRTGSDKFELSQSLAGEPSWIYSGLAIIDHEKMAVMENRSTHESATVREGGMFKSSKVLRITADGIAFLNAKGVEETVLRYIGDDALKKAPLADIGLQPLNVQPALSGMISNGDQPSMTFGRNSK